MSEGRSCQSFISTPFIILFLRYTNKMSDDNKPKVRNGKTPKLTNNSKGQCRNGFRKKPSYGVVDPRMQLYANALRGYVGDLDQSPTCRTS